MEYILLILGFCLILLSIVGSILPALPGVPFAWIGLLCLYFIDGIPTNYWLLGITLFFTLLITIADYIIPAKGTKKFGGSKYGIWGTNIGIVLGIFIPIPFAFIVCPFLGALIGELIFNSEDKNRAFKAAFGSFLGFISGMFMKIIFCLIMFIVFIWQSIKYWDIWF